MIFILWLQCMDYNFFFIVLVISLRYICSEKKLIIEKKEEEIFWVLLDQIHVSLVD